MSGPHPPNVPHQLRQKVQLSTFRPLLRVRFPSSDMNRSSNPKTHELNPHACVWGRLTGNRKM